MNFVWSFSYYAPDDHEENKREIKELELNLKKSAFIFEKPFLISRQFLSRDCLSCVSLTKALLTLNRKNWYRFL